MSSASRAASLPDDPVNSLMTSTLLPILGKDARQILPMEFTHMPKLSQVPADAGRQHTTLVEQQKPCRPIFYLIKHETGNHSREGREVGGRQPPTSRVGLEEGGTTPQPKTIVLYPLSNNTSVIL